MCTDDRIIVAEHDTGLVKLRARCFSHPALTGEAIIGKSDTAKGTIIYAVVFLWHTHTLGGWLNNELPCPVRITLGLTAMPPESSLYNRCRKNGVGKICTRFTGKKSLEWIMGTSRLLKSALNKEILTQLFKYCFVAFINMKVRPEDSLKIENIVASAKVTDYLDLPMLASKIEGAEYNKKRFPGVVLRMQDPKIAALVFGSGKVVLTGAKSVNSLSKGLNILGDKLRELGIDIPKKLEYKIQNIVTSADLATPINLNKIAVGFNLDKIEYEPEQFPGLVYRLDIPKVVVLLFGSGKLIITGGKEPDDAKKAVVKILSDLRSLGLIT
jgi:transcription initiation factor TFIID TATA-box-binding protein